MDCRAQTLEKVDEGNLGTRGEDDQDIREGKPGRRPEPEPTPVDSLKIFRHIQSIFPAFLIWIKEVRDPRKRPDLATFPVDYLLLLSLLMFCSQCKSRRRLGKALIGGRLSSNVWRMIGKAYKAVCHVDTMNNVMEQVDSEDLERLIVKVVGQMRTRKMLRNFLLNGNMIVVMDGTQIFRVNEPVGEGWLTRTKDGKTTYSRYVLAAKIVTVAGLVIPFAFEFCENPNTMEEFEKQDCEIKAWRRLIEKIHRLYPRLKITILADSLFAEESTFTQCRKLGWDFIITQKDDKLPSVNKQLPAVGEPWTGERKQPAFVNGKKTKGTYHVRWLTPVSYHGEIYHIIELTEFGPDGTQVYYNRWITNVKPNEQNALDLALHGRLRWKIENEGTNTQKNGGYEMEHAYGHNGNAWKNYYLILQVAQLFNDLVYYTDILTTLADDVRSTFARLYGSMSAYADNLREALRRDELDEAPLWGGKKVQIRFCSA
jgi:hypothetical protein